MPAQPLDRTVEVMERLKRGEKSADIAAAMGLERQLVYNLTSQARNRGLIPPRAVRFPVALAAELWAEHLTANAAAKRAGTSVAAAHTALVNARKLGKVPKDAHWVYAGKRAATLFQEEVARRLAHGETLMEIAQERGVTYQRIQQVADIARSRGFLKRTWKLGPKHPDNAVIPEQVELLHISPGLLDDLGV